jgi:hypothetical protein
MRVVIRNRFTLQKILKSPKRKNACSRGFVRRACGKMRLTFLVWLLPTAIASADLTISTTPGMTWNYNMTQEVGQGLRLSDLKADVDGKFRATVAYRLDGTQKVDDKDFLKFEMHRAGVITNTDLITVDKRGVVCVARIDLNGQIVKLDPPQILVAAPLQTGTTWEFNGEISHSKVHQHYEIIGEEDVEVPAGKFHAFHIRGKQKSPGAMTIDRWFVNGTGIVKDVTETRTETDELLRRISLELKESPKIAARPEIKSVEGTKRLNATLVKQPMGKAMVNFAADTPKIYARWQGHGLRNQAKIRAVWIAENMGDDAPPDYKADEATTTATAPDSHGVFTLSRPDNGWTRGEYRVEFYVDDALVDTVKITITK